MLLYRGNTTYKIYNDKKIDIINIEEFLDNLDKFLKDDNDNLIKARVFNILAYIKNITKR